MIAVKYVIPKTVSILDTVEFEGFGSWGSWGSWVAPFSEPSNHHPMPQTSERAAFCNHPMGRCWLHVISV